MMTETITLRRATPEDCEATFHWRNDPSVRQHSINAAAIDRETHQRWFAKSLENPDRIILIGEVQGKPVGVLRYDLAGNQAAVSVYLVPGFAGKGFGTSLLIAGSDWMNQKYSTITTIEATVLHANVASRKAFEKAGYKLAHEDENFLIYHFNLTDEDA
jgi:UDP-2,4-diacetamido-2,4,6-trideoxy-beta-L-altropyranose hydrolase